MMIQLGVCFKSKLFKTFFSTKRASFSLLLSNFRFMEIIRKQDIEKKTPGIVKTVFFNLLVDIGKNKDEKIINRILRHYSTHFQRKHQDNKRRFLLKNPDFNHASDLIDELFREFTSRPQPLITTVATVPRVTTNPQATLSNLDLVPMSIMGANKKASIIKVDKPFPMDEHVQQNLENVRQPQIMRSSEPTPIINKGETFHDFFLYSKA